MLVLQHPQERREALAPGLEIDVLTGTDLKASNSFDAPRRVVPQELPKPQTTGGHTRFEVPPSSYTVIQWGS